MKVGESRTVQRVKIEYLECVGGVQLGAYKHKFEIRLDMGHWGSVLLEEDQPLDWLRHILPTLDAEVLKAKPFDLIGIELRPNIADATQHQDLYVPLIKFRDFDVSHLTRRAAAIAQSSHIFQLDRPFQLNITIVSRSVVDNVKV